jgi:hypothetical protein
MKEFALWPVAEFVFSKAGSLPKQHVMVYVIRR